MAVPREEVVVDLGARRYSILIGSGLLGVTESYGALTPGRAAVLICNPVVDALYGEQVGAALSGMFGVVHRLTIPDGEAHKDWTTLLSIFDALLANRCDRETTIFALGGGVTGDIAGFAAACYMRGIACVQLPTTLLAQVDSAVGGKTAINHPRGKNMIGAFHQPARVVIDVDTLATLPQREFVAGLAEVIKYGAIADDEFLGWIDRQLPGLLAGDKPALIHAVRRSCEIKAAIVGIDEREAGVRAILNFGHTFAHAIETGLGFGTWLHGEAVGCGMVMAADLSVRLGLIGRASADRLTALIARAGLPVLAPALGVERTLELMAVDKKASGGDLRFVVLTGPGQAMTRAVDEAAVAATIESCSSPR